MEGKTLVIIILIFLGVILLAQNTQVTSFQFLMWKLSMSRIIFLLFAMTIGFLLGVLIKKK